MKPLDFVRTPKGAIALVTEVGNQGNASIDFIGGGNPSGEKNAWWREGDGLQVIDSLPHLLSGMTAHPLGNNRNQNDIFFPVNP